MFSAKSLSCSGFTRIKLQKHKDVATKNQRECAVQNKSNDSLVNCDNKTNHCNRYVSDGLLSGQNGSKLSIDDESSHPINGSNTNNNKSERKRNINMLNDDDDDDDDIDAKSVGCDGNAKRMKVDSDGQDNNKNKMYQVSIRREK
jgi:hypothetical protein